MENTVHLSLSLLTVIFLMAATWYAYNEGYMNPLIEKVGVFMMRARAEAEAKEMQAKGLKEGGGLLDSKLKGNQQAAEVKAAGIGSLGGLKKDL